MEKDVTQVERVHVEFNILQLTLLDAALEQDDYYFGSSLVAPLAYANLSSSTFSQVLWSLVY